MNVRLCFEVKTAYIEAACSGRTLTGIGSFEAISLIPLVKVKNNSSLASY
jgi:hypothetical protein